MFKYFFNICASKANSNAMHDFMLTPEGITAIVFETFFLVSFSFWAAYFEKDVDKVKQARRGAEKARFNDEEVKPQTLIDMKPRTVHHIVAAWPFFRDIMKGLKNAYVGLRSTILFINLLGVNLNFLVLPLGIVLGVLAAANRYRLRAIVESRKDMMDYNEDLLKEIQEARLMYEDDRPVFLKRIQFQQKSDCDKAFVCAAIGGFIDGLYMYIGILGLAVFAPHALIAMGVLCATYTIAYIITRVYEEHEYQLKLEVTQTKCKLEIIAKLMETMHDELTTLRKKKQDDATKNDTNKINPLERELHKLCAEFDEMRTVLKNQNTRSYKSAILLGVKNGLYAYSALSSLIFVVGAILLLSSIPCPPLLLLILIPLGVAFIGGFVGHSVTSNYYFLKEQEQKESDSDSMRLRNIISQERNIEKNNELATGKEFKEALEERMNVPPAPVYFFQEWFEVIRSFCSGLTKGQRFIEFAANPLKEQDNQGQYRDSFVMLILVGISASVFSCVLALRALAKGFGRLPGAKAKSDKSDSDTNCSTSPKDRGPIDPVVTPTKTETKQIETKLATNSAPLQPKATMRRSNSLHAGLGIFGGSLLNQSKSVNVSPVLNGLNSPLPDSSIQLGI
ncbi:MAG: hypothetical protein WC627_07960 [Legionella sp.]